MSKLFAKFLVSFAGIAIYSSSSLAYLSLLTTGDILAPQQFQIMGYVEGVLDTGYDGLNLNTRGSLGINDELQVDAELGLGEFDITLGAFLKWVPVPDVEGQPAIGVRGGVSYFKWNDFSQTTITAMPFLSKAFSTNLGRVSPYVGLPLGINTHNSDSDFFTRLAVGSEVTQTQFENLRFIGELGLELSKSFASITVGAAYDF